MRLILHIGTEKTGTTAVQSWLWRNRDVLAKHGIGLPTFVRSPAMAEFAVACRSPGNPCDVSKGLGVHGEEDLTQFRRWIENEISEDVIKKCAEGMKEYFISAEHLHSRLYHPEDAARVHTLLAKYFNKIEIFCFLRPQIDIEISLFSTRSRLGWIIGRSLLDRVTPEDPYYSYNDLLARWAAAFGADAVTPVAFRRNARPVAFFRELLGLQDAADLQPEQRVNSALDHRVIAMNNALVRAARAGGDQAPVRRLPLDRLPCEEPLTLSRDTARAVQARFAESNAALCAAWPAIRPEDLEPDWSRYPEVGNFERLDQVDWSGFLLQILSLQHAAQRRAQGRAAASEAALMKAKGRLPRALALQRQAVSHLADAAALTPDDAELGAQVAQARAELDDLASRQPAPAGPAPGVPPAAE